MMERDAADVDKMGPPEDHEIVCMKNVMTAVAGLSSSAAVRVLAYALNRKQADVGALYSSSALGPLSAQQIFSQKDRRQPD